MSQRALMLDLDGTLADTISALRAVYFQIMSECHLEGSDADFQQLNGPPLAHSARMICAERARDIDPDELTQRWLSLAKAACGSARPLDGAVELLEAARDRKWHIAIVTSGTKAAASEWLATHGLVKYIDVVIGGDSVVRGKPSPDPYLAALAALGADARTSIAIEDSPAGASSALATGATTCMLLADGRDPHPQGVLPIRHLDAARELISHDPLTLSALPSALSVSIDKRRADVTATMLRDIDAIWDEERASRPHAHDGELVTLSRFDPDALQGKLAPYRFWIAQQRRPDLAIGLAPLAVSGILRSPDGLVLGRRSASVGAAAGRWEFAPSGSVDGTRVSATGSIDLLDQLACELREEIGLPPEAITSARPFGLVRNTVSGLFDAVISLTTLAPGATILDAHAHKGSDEYDEISIVPPSELAAFGHRVDWQIVDVTSHIVGEIISRRLDFC